MIFSGQTAAFESKTHQQQIITVDVKWWKMMREENKIKIRRGKKENNK